MLKRRRKDIGKGFLMAKKVARLMGPLKGEYLSGSENESDVENEQGNGEAVSAPRIVDFNEDEYQLPDGASTDFRKRNIKLLSEQSDRYKGIVARRSDLEYDSSEDDDDDDDDDEESGNAVEDNTESEDAISDNNVSDSDDWDGDKNSYGSDEDEDISEESEIESEVEVMSKVCQQTQIQKGVSIQNQLGLWERLLEMRLHMQKLVSRSNQMAMIDKSMASEENKDTIKQKELELRKQTSDNLLGVLKGLLEIQQGLTQQNSETQNALKDTSIKNPLELGMNCEDIESQLQNRFVAFKEHRNAVLLKWDDRTKLMSEATIKRSHSAENYNILNKIHHVLNNRKDLIKKSQVFKGKGETKLVENGSTEAVEEYNPEVYDDSEFYHQQLRELIEYKTNAGTNVSNISKQLLELQKIRQKMKRKVNTKASKGRRLRYTVHNKLISFMAPKTTDSCTDEYKNELFKSLFV